MLVARSRIPGQSWPAIPTPGAGTILAILFQLERSQWWPIEEIRRHQLAQLGPLVAHARETVPGYRKLWRGVHPGGALDLDRLGDLPILDRRRLQKGGRAFRSQRYPTTHGPLNTVTTSGSTGTPVEALHSEVHRAMWTALTLRNDLWHGRDMREKLAMIRFVADGARARPPKGDHQSSWNPVLNEVVHTGPSATLSLSSDLEAQVAWLVREDPVYLLTFPTNLHALALRFRETGRTLPRLRGVTTVGETLPEDTRVLVREVFGADIADMYSSQELGYIALNCPDQPGYHVQSESVLVEVLDEEGAPCRPGEVGRIVATSLINWATPFIRYEIGDYAEVGEPCPCGRGLPVLRRILGRARNMLRRPDGTVSWPYIESVRCLAAAPYRQMQLVQVDAETIQVNIVPAAPLTDDHRRALSAELQRSLGYPFEFRFHTVETIERGRGGKFEEFVSMVSDG